MCSVSVGMSNLKPGELVGGGASEKVWRTSSGWDSSTAVHRTNGRYVSFTFVQSFFMIRNPRRTKRWRLSCLRRRLVEQRYCRIQCFGPLRWEMRDHMLEKGRSEIIQRVSHLDGMRRNIMKVGVQDLIAGNVHSLPTPTVPCDFSISSFRITSSFGLPGLVISATTFIDA